MADKCGDCRYYNKKDCPQYDDRYGKSSTDKHHDACRDYR